MDTYQNNNVDYVIEELDDNPPKNSCTPSPCGPNALCIDSNGSATCSCQPDYHGSPPNCRPECRSNSDCSSRLICINHKCKDPCPGSCGINAVCHVTNHQPICSCQKGYNGDPFTLCSIISSKNYE